MGFKLAELFVDIKANDSALQSQLGGVKTQLSGMGVAIGTAVGSLAASAIQAGASAIAGFFGSGVKGAVDLKETMSKVGTVFGDSAGMISARADQMAAKFGVVRGEFINAASDFGSAFKAIGQSQGDAAELGNTLAKLGMDMASFNNTSTEQAFTALRAALRGEFDPLERFNVMLSAAAIEQEALSSGIIKSAKDLDEASKKQATFNLLMKKTVDQQGDMERTADGSANSWRKFTGTIENMAVELGGTLEPAINSILNVGNEMLGGLQAGFASIEPSIVAFGDTVKEYAQAIGVAWRNMGDIWQIVQINLAAGIGNFLNYLAVLPENVAIVANYIARNWYQIVYDGVSASITVFQNFSENLVRLVDSLYEFLRNPTKGFHVDFKPILEGFTATVEKFPELVKPVLVQVDSQIAAITDRMAAREAKRLGGAKAAVSAVEKAGQSAAASVGKKQSEFKSETLGVADFAVKLRESIYGNPQVVEQKKTNLLLDGANKNLAIIAKRSQTERYLALGK